MWKISFLVNLQTSYQNFNNDNKKTRLRINCLVGIT